MQQSSARKAKIEKWLEDHEIITLTQIYVEPWGELWRSECNKFGKVVIQIMAEGEEGLVRVFDCLSNQNAADAGFVCQKVHAFDVDLGICVFEDLAFDHNPQYSNVMRSSVMAMYGAVQAHFCESREIEKILPRTLAVTVLEDVLKRAEGPFPGDVTNLFQAMPGDDAPALLQQLLDRRGQLTNMARIVDAQIPTINHTNLTAGNFHMRSSRKLCITRWDDAVLSAPGWSLFQPFEGVMGVHRALHDRASLRETERGMGDMRAMDSYLDILRRSINIEEMDRLTVLPRAAVFGFLYHISTYFRYPVTQEQYVEYGAWTKAQLKSLLAYLEVAETFPDRTPPSTEKVPSVKLTTQVEARDAANVFREQGCLVIKDAVPKATIDRLTASLADSRERQEAEVAEGRALEVGDHRFMMTPDMDGPFGDPEVIAAPRVMGVLDFLFNLSGCILGSHTVVTSYPGAKAQLMHRDNVDLFPEIVNQETPPFLVSVVIPLVPLNRRVGGTELVLRSHIHRNPEEPTAPRVLPDVDVGDAFLMDARLLHRGLPNLSDHARPIIISCYQRQWYRDFQNFIIQPPLVSPEKALERLPDQRKRLLEYTTYP